MKKSYKQKKKNTTRSLIRKDILPALQQNLVIYRFKYYCNADYVVKIIQWQEVRITQNLLGSIHRYTRMTSSGH